MSEQIGAVRTARGELTVTAFWGGAERGCCVQLTQGHGCIPSLADGDTPGFVQLSVADLRALLPLLTAFVEGRVQR